MQSKNTLDLPLDNPVLFAFILTNLDGAIQMLLG